MRILAILILVTIGCSSSPEHRQQETTFVDFVTPTESYGDILEKWSQSEKAYNGIMATFQVSATLLSNDVITQQVYQDAKQYHWSPEQFREARQKVMKEAEGTTTVYLSLFTEKDTVNNLDKTDSVWNIYLKVGEATVKPASIKRVYENPVALAAKYPYANVWSRGYYIKFPMGTSVATSSPVTLILAGPVGDANLKFPK